MKTILEYLETNDEILNLISEVLEESLLTEEEIQESFLFESEKKFNPKDNDELKNLIEIEVQDTKSIDEFNNQWIKYLKDHNINTKKYFPFKLFCDDWSELPNTLKIDSNNIGICLRDDKFNISEFNWKKKTREKTIVSIKYDYSKSFFDNLIKLFHEDDILWYQLVNWETTVEKNNYNFKFDKSELKNYEDINIEDLKNKEDNNDSNSSKDEVQDKVEDSIKDNKDLLTPLAKEANITGEKLRDIITKVCLDKSGKPRKLDESVILGLSVMLCGVILTIKKSGKSDNAAILAVTDKITKIVKNKKSIKNTI